MAATEGEVLLKSRSIAGAKEGKASPATWTMGIDVR